MPERLDRVSPQSREIDVAHVARLARLNLTAEEAELFQGQLERVLEYAQKLRTVDVAADVAPAEESAEKSSAGETPAATSETARDDEPRAGFAAQDALSNAPREANDLFIVPKVVE